MELNILWYVGILVPTTITVGFFIGFLWCWFRCGLNRKLSAIRQRKKTPSIGGQREIKIYQIKEPRVKPLEAGSGNAGDEIEKESQHSADSAIDLGEVEICAVEETGGPIPDMDTHLAPAHSLSNRIGTLVNYSQSCVGSDDAHDNYNVSKGSYPSYEKLNEEIHSEPRIYETHEDIEFAMNNGLMNTRRCNTNRPSSRRRHHSIQPAQQHVLVRAVPAVTSHHLPPRRRQYWDSSSDYGFKKWRPECNGRSSSLAGALVPSEPVRLEWRPYLTYSHDSIDNYSVEIMHV